MRNWIKKLVEQFEIDASPNEMEHLENEMSSEKASLLFLIDTLNKNLIDVEGRSLRKTRTELDKFAKSLMIAPSPDNEKILFDFRQWYASYRIDETTYVQNTFDDLKKLIWEFAHQLSDDVSAETQEDQLLHNKLNSLREAVESNSVDTLRSCSKEFISSYLEHQTKKTDRKKQRITRSKKNLDSLKKQLVQAHHTMQRDHLTGIFNRRSFDEKLNGYLLTKTDEMTDACLIIADIDHFKKVNDTYGHDIGDFVIKECAQILTDSFTLPGAMVARIGGEEFGIILPGISLNQVNELAEHALNNIRKAVFVHGELQIKFTMSMGVASYEKGDTADKLYKKSDSALYQSKQSGRNRWTIHGALKAA